MVKKGKKNGKKRGEGESKTGMQKKKAEKTVKKEVLQNGADKFAFSEVIIIRNDLRKKLSYLDAWAQQYIIRCAFMKGRIEDKERDAFLQKSQEYMRSIENDMHYLQQAYEAALQNVKRDGKGAE